MARPTVYIIDLSSTRPPWLPRLPLRQGSEPAVAVRRAALADIRCCCRRFRPFLACLPRPEFEREIEGDTRSSQHNGSSRLGAPKDQHDGKDEVSIGTLSLDGLETDVWGSAAAVLALLGRFRAHWRRVVQALSLNYRCVAYDHRGCGESDAPAERGVAYQRAHTHSRGRPGQTGSDRTTTA